MKKILKFILSLDAEQTGCLVLILYFIGALYMVGINILIANHVLPVVTPWFGKP